MLKIVSKQEKKAHLKIGKAMPPSIAGMDRVDNLYDSPHDNQHVDVERGILSFVYAKVLKHEEPSTCNLIDEDVVENLFCEPKWTDVESLHVVENKDMLSEAVLDVSIISQEVGQISTFNDME